VVILSEEPFWDTLWGLRPLDRHRVIDTAHGALPVIQLNHQTSEIFAFDRIPYYLLTNHRFATTYMARFRRNRVLTPEAWRDRFAARVVDVSFMFERRPEPHHSMRWLGAELFGLCAWRTELAEACTTGRVERLGRSWQGGPSRFELEDWYLDKMARMNGRARIAGALENTHHPHYLSEKIFDAFANGALPLYWAGPGHRVHEFGLPVESWMNLHGLAPREAADQVNALAASPDWPIAVFEDYAEAQARLAALFCNTSLWAAERDRLASAVPRELARVLDAAHPAEA
jgi:hypothetical protein